MLVVIFIVTGTLVNTIQLLVQKIVEICSTSGCLANTLTLELFQKTSPQAHRGLEKGKKKVQQKLNKSLEQGA